jgi:peptide/nickel transport system ATP-binding protein
MSDEMMVMKNGKVMESGNAETIYMNPQSEYTQELLDAIPRTSLA